MAVAFKQWLSTVDEPPKGEEFLDKVINLMSTGGVELEDPCDLAGAHAPDVITSFGVTVSHKMTTFVHRAIMQATKEFCGKFVPQQQPDTQEALKQQDVGDALDAFFQKKKQGVKKIHFLLGQHLPAISLKDLDKDAWPHCAAMDSAATEIARLNAKMVEAGATP